VQRHQQAHQRFFGHLGIGQGLLHGRGQRVTPGLGLHRRRSQRAQTKRNGKPEASGDAQAGAFVSAGQAMAGPPAQAWEGEGVGPAPLSEDSGRPAAGA
jgi:hypothetical protein